MTYYAKVSIAQKVYLWRVSYYPKTLSNSDQWMFSYNRLKLEKIREIANLNLLKNSYWIIVFQQIQF